MQRSSGFIVSLTSLQKWVAWREKLPWDTMPGKELSPTPAEKVGWLIQFNANCQSSWKWEEWFGASPWKIFKHDLLWSPFSNNGAWKKNTPAFQSAPSKDPHLACPEELQRKEFTPSGKFTEQAELTTWKLLVPKALQKPVILLAWLLEQLPTCSKR